VYFPKYIIFRCAHAHRHKHAYAHTHTHTQTRISTHTQTQTRIHTHTHTDIDTHTHTHTQASTHTHTHTHTRTHTIYTTQHARTGARIANCQRVLLLQRYSHVCSLTKMFYVTKTMFSYTHSVTSSKLVNAHTQAHASSSGCVGMCF